MYDFLYKPITALNSDSQRHSFVVVQLHVEITALQAVAAAAACHGDCRGKSWQLRSPEDLQDRNCGKLIDHVMFTIAGMMLFGPIAVTLFLLPPQTRVLLR